MVEVFTSLRNLIITVRIQGRPGPPLFLDQTKNKWFGRLTPPPLSKGLDDPHPPYLKVWIRHCITFSWLSTFLFFFFTNKRDLFIEIQLTIDSHYQEVKLVFRSKRELVINRPQNHGMVLARVDSHSVFCIPGKAWYQVFAFRTSRCIRSPSRDSAEIIVLGPYLCTQPIRVCAIISLLKMPLSICQSRIKEIRNALPVIRWVCWVPRRRISALLRRRY